MRNKAKIMLGTKNREPTTGRNGEILEETGSGETMERTERSDKDKREHKDSTYTLTRG